MRKVWGSVRECGEMWGECGKRCHVSVGGGVGWLWGEVSGECGGRCRSVGGLPPHPNTLFYTLHIHPIHSSTPPPHPRLLSSSPPHYPTPFIFHPYLTHLPKLPKISQNPHHPYCPIHTLSFTLYRVGWAVEEWVGYLHTSHTPTHFPTLTPFTFPLPPPYFPSYPPLFPHLLHTYQLLPYSPTHNQTTKNSPILLPSILSHTPPNSRYCPHSFPYAPILTSSFTPYQNFSLFSFIAKLV